MKTNSPKGKESHHKGNIFFENLSAKTINKIARVSGYLQRKGGKIDARSLIIGFMMLMTRKINTYEAWASEVSILTGKTITRQAIEERMTPATSEMLRLVLEKTMAENIHKRKLKCKERTKSKFRSILLEDSTLIHLPDELSDVFPGNLSKGKKKSLVKIHALHNFTKNNFPYIGIQSFTDNDQSLSSKVLNYVTEGDLILRDLGFLVLGVLKKILLKGVYAISRKKATTKSYDIKTGEEIHLAKELRKTHFYDGMVLVGRTEKIQMRLIAIPLPAEQAAERKRKAKNDRDKRLNHNKEYYTLLEYAILITNIAETMCGTKEICELYGLRWQIEIIFKSWKSCFSLERLSPAKCKNPERVFCMIYLFLLFIVLFQVLWIKAQYNTLTKQGNQLQLSLMKMAQFFMQHFHIIILLKNNRKIIEQIKSQCRYDTRKDRLNIMQKYEKLAA